MKVSIEWLREWVNPTITNEQLAHQLTMTGLEIESIAPVAGQFSNVKVGHIIAIEQHPNAERLRVCQVDVGAGETLQIVCGAANARLDLKVAAALVGAELPNGLVIKKAKLRGVESHGMLCSVSELGIATSADGILELPVTAPIGQDIIEYLQLNDETIDINITPNRGDCLSILGIAREVAAINAHTITPVAIAASQPTIKDKLPIKINANKDCSHYVGRVIKNINSKATTPIWIQERLRRSDINCIHPVVDITNYVMLELGQPMHAFDCAKLDAEIQIRHAQNNEQLTLLDKQTITLKEGTLVIADKNAPQALAGVMGGANSAINQDTQHIFLESAFFLPLAVINSEKQYNLFSESSRRFSRGVDPTLQVQALERATALICEIVGGEVGPIVEQQPTNYAVVSIELRRAQIKRILGFELANEEVEGIFNLLGMQISPLATGWQVEVPAYRFDVRLEIDLIEELARVYGYDRIPQRQPQGALQVPKQSEALVNSAEFKKLLVDMGYYEVISYSFIDPTIHEAFFSDVPGLTLVNPISAEMAVMRTSLWPGLVNTILYNQNRQQTRGRFFETGLCFIKGQGLYQVPYIAGAIVGNLHPEQWGVQSRAVDFFDIKNDVENLLRLTGEFNSYTFTPADHSALHPTQSALITYNGNVVGHVGALHPVVAKKLKLDCQVYLFEIELDKIAAGQLPKFNPLSKFPSMRRDIAFIIDKQRNFNEIYAKIQKSADNNLQSIRLFDIYQGNHMPADKKSVAVGLVFQNTERTLTDKEVNNALDKIVQTLVNDFGARLRD